MTKENTDLKESKECNEKLQRLLQDIEMLKAEKQKISDNLDFFLYNVSHDLKTPLTQVIGFLELFEGTLETPLSEKSKKFLDIAQSAAKRLARMIDAVLKISRINSLPFLPQKVELTPLIEETIKEINEIRLKQANEKDHILKWNLDKMPSVSGDPTLLKELFLELIRNAVHFSAHSNPSMIKIGCTQNNKNNNEVIISVEDNGLGFDEKHLSSLFKLFQSLHSSSETQGVGGGLAMVKNIVEKHGGRIWAKGEENKGATFFFTLPIFNRP